MFPKWKVFFSTALASTGLILGSPSAVAQTFAYVSGAGPDEVTVVDTSTITVAATIPVEDSRDLAITPDGNFAYVLSANGPVSVIDTAINAVVDTVSIGPGSASSIAISPDGAFAYVPKWSPFVSDVSVIDTSTNLEVANVPLSRRTPTDIAITPDGAFAYVTITGATPSVSNVSVIDTSSNTVVDEIPGGFGFAPQGIAITPDGAFAYVTTAGSGADAIVVIETSSNTVIDTIPLTISGPRRVAITPDGAFAYVAHDVPLVPKNVSVIDTAANAVVDTVLVPGSPYSVDIAPGGAFAYVAGRSQLSVIDTATNTMTTSIPVIGVFVAITPLTTNSVEVDIRPFRRKNWVIPNVGFLPVAVLTTEDFDAQSINEETVRFGPNGAPIWYGISALFDVDHDQDLDLVMLFRTRKTGIQCGDTEATLNGETFDEVLFEGSDGIHTIFCHPH